MPENKERSPIQLVNLSNIDGKAGDCAIFNIETSTPFQNKQHGRVWVTKGGSVIKEERANGEFYLLSPQAAVRWFFSSRMEKNCPHDILKSLLIK